MSQIHIFMTQNVLKIKAVVFYMFIRTMLNKLYRVFRLLFADCTQI